MKREPVNFNAERNRDAVTERREQYGNPSFKRENQIEILSINFIVHWMFSLSLPNGITRPTPNQRTIILMECFDDSKCVSLHFFNDRIENYYEKRIFSGPFGLPSLWSALKQEFSITSLLLNARCWIDKIIETYKKNKKTD